MPMKTKIEVLSTHLKDWLATKPYSQERRFLREQLANTLKLHENSIARAMKRIQLERSGRKQKVGRPRIYTKEHDVALHLIWQSMQYPCAEVLHPMLDTYIASLVRNNEWNFNLEAEGYLKNMSIGTIKNKISIWRVKENRTRGYSATTPSKLKILIPIRKSHTWHTLPVGYVQMDTVVNCGDTLTADVLYSLGMVDFWSYWVEYITQWNKGELATLESFKILRKRFPFVIKEAHPDTGNEFINYHFYRYAEDPTNELSLTRSEPYKKNDNMCIEERNNNIPRRHLGYPRISDQTLIPLCSEILEVACIIHNHFRPVKRMLTKERIGAKWHRTFEKVARTPYARIINNPDVSEENKTRLNALHEKLDPLSLERKLSTLKAELIRKLEKNNR